MKAMTTMLCLSLSLLIPAINSQADQVRDILNNFQQDMMQSASGQMQPNSVRDILYPAPAYSDQSASTVRTVLNQFQIDNIQNGNIMTAPLTTLQINNNPYDAVAYYQPVRYVAAYAPPMYYAAPYPQQYSQSVTNWLFGTPRPPSAPMNVTEAHAEQAEPTPQPAATVAAEPVIIRPATVQASVIAAPGVTTSTRQVEEHDTTTSATPDLTVWDMLAYWTRKILLTGVLLCIGAFAWYKEHAAKHEASRRLADLEQEMHRLDRLIYGDDRKGKDTP